MSTYSDFDNKLEARLKGRLQAEAWGETEGREIDSLAQRIVVGSESSPASTGRGFQRTLRRSLGYVAASVLFAWVSWQMLHSRHDTTNPETYVSYATQAGQRARVPLSDGSVILLAAGSKLQVANGFGTKNRNVVLTGEALFTVFAHTSLPFIVRAGNTTTRVIGTTFAVRKYGNDAAARVVVAEGKVSLNNTILTTGTSGTVSRTGDVRVEANANTGVALSWSLGALSFNETPLRDVIPELNRWYGLEIQVSNPDMLAHRITTSLQVESPTQGIALIAQLLEAKAVRSGNVVTFMQR